MTLDIEARSSGPGHQPRHIRYVSGAVSQVVEHAVRMARVERPLDGIVVIIRRTP
jgi:hypothetical protein